MTFADWKQDATADEQAVAVCFNRRLYRDWQEASDALEMGRHDPDQVEQLAARVVDLTEQVEQDRAAHTFVFRTLPYSVWREAVEGCPPSDDQIAKQKWLEYDPERFPPAAVALSCHDPELSEQDGLWLREHLPRGEFARLFDAVLQVNVGGSSIPKSGVAIAKMLASELRSTTPPNTGSR